jgi:phosphate transport system protein
MVRSNFERELQKLRDQILTLGSQVSENIVQSVDVLQDRNIVAAQQLIAGDKEVNQKRINIMNEALILIATQQPMAGDMRLTAAAIEISGELERVNDYVKGIARIALMIDPEPLPDAMDGLPLMAQKTRDMLRKALDAASRNDTELARTIPAEDDEVDELFNETYRRLITFVGENPDKIELANHLEWAAHNLERAADRVTNICEWVVYMTTGEYIEMDSEIEAPPS